MTYPQNFEEKIGFDKIRHFISERCLSTLGSERVNEMKFLTSCDTIERLLRETEEFTRILQSEDDFPADYFFDIRPSLQRVRIEGTFLDETELFNLRRSLETIRNIVGYFITEEGEECLYPHLQALATDVVVFPQLLTRIDQIIDKFGHIKDNASPELAQIRRELNHTLSGISRSLNIILRNAQNEGIVDKEVAPTLREGRLVIPVIPAHKRRIKGIVHDESASGKTVYIEPAEVVEANNRIRELEGEERREIMRILTLFTDELRPHLPDIAYSYEFLADIDFIRAKALFSLETNALLPHFEKCRQIEWYHAVHPLLYLALKKQNKSVVPLDITLTPEQRILLISGPNAGGKSVCLKTTGLLQYMLQCGLLIPVYENSHAGIFDHIFIDIGDEQSIENDLSTYSSHLTNMKYFVKNCNEGTLLLIDEFGGGTEPQIGGAIAEVLLDRFNRKGAYGVITTHYQNLKQFAKDTPGIINGAMLYDRHMMQPLFKLSIGNPGSSFAIEIARKIGLPEDVIADASEKVGSDYIDMDKYLQDIVRDKRYWENKRQNIRQREKQLEELTRKYSDDLQEIEKERKRILKEAKQKAEQLIAESNARIENTIRTIKEAEAEKERTKAARQALHSFKDELSNDEENNDAISRKIAKIRNGIVYRMLLCRTREMEISTRIQTARFLFFFSHRPPLFQTWMRYTVKSSMKSVSALSFHMKRRIRWVCGFAARKNSASSIPQAGKRHFAAYIALHTGHMPDHDAKIIHVGNEGRDAFPHFPLALEALHCFVLLIVLCLCFASCVKAPVPFPLPIQADAQALPRP